MGIDEKLLEMGIKIPEAPRPVASYVPGLICGNLLYVSGQFPLHEGRLLAEGKLGRDVDIESGKAAARQAGINCLGVIKSLIGSLERVERIVKITGYVQSVENFYDQPQVINGVSDLMIEIFEEKGRHARVAVGVNVLPLNAPCEIELIAQIKDEC
ncbi:MAG: RidA family protein [Chitinophagales bacterium]